MTAKKHSSFSDIEAEAVALVPRKVQCHVARLLQDLDPDDAVHVRRALANRSLPATALHRALTAKVKAEVLPSTSSIQRHRSSACNCPEGDR